MNRFAISGVGSLPHPHCDAALEHVFKYDLPFVPQLPKRSKQETMIYQTLDGIGDMSLGPQGQVEIKKLFSPPNWQTQQYFDSYRCLQPFLFEAEQRKCSKIKIQLTGAFTLFSYTDYPTKNLAYFQTLVNFLIEKIKSITNKTSFPNIYLQIDEPALFLLQSIQIEMFTNYMKKLCSLKNKKLKIGIHCCSNGYWEQLLSHPLDFLSFDWNLSINQLLLYKKQLLHIPELFLGVVPTQVEQLASFSPFNFYHQLMQNFSPNEQQKLLKSCYITTSCGLGHNSLKDLPLFYQALQITKTP